MTINIDEKTIALWFLEINENCDWMAVLSSTGENTFAVEYRFRYYADDKVHGSDDTKNWYRATGTGTKEKAMGMAKQVVAALEAQCGQKADELVMGDSVEEFTLQLLAKPWAHARPLGVGEE